jgi:hypothetical protein
MDRTRFAEMEAIREGRPAPGPQSELARGIVTLMVSLVADPDLFRAALEYVGTITPVQEILARPEVVSRIADAQEVLKDKPRSPVPGPTRDELLRLVS